MFTNATQLTKIDMIKIVRALLNFGLVQAKTVVDAWLEAYGVDRIDRFDLLGQFITFVGALNKGTIVLDENNILRPQVPPIINNRDILAISRGEWTASGALK